MPVMPLGLKHGEQDDQDRDQVLAHGRRLSEWGASNCRGTPDRYAHHDRTWDYLGR
ncbi:hypothetical protein D9M69_729010 [compost metagenome]